MASAPLILKAWTLVPISLLTCYHRHWQYISEHEWQVAVEDGRGSQCRHILWQSVHCNAQQVGANLTQTHQSTAPGSSRWRLEGQKCWGDWFCECGATQLHASVHPHSSSSSFTPSVAALKCNSSICLFSHRINWFEPNSAIASIFESYVSFIGRIRPFKLHSIMCTSYRATEQEEEHDFNHFHLHIYKVYYEIHFNIHCIFHGI